MATFDAAAIILPSPLVAKSQFHANFAAAAVRLDFQSSYNEGFAAGLQASTYPDVAASVGFFATKLDGTPVTGLSPTWLAYYNAASGAPQAGPAFTEVANGNYKFTPSGTSPAGVIDLGATATPRYLVYGAASSVKTFGAFDEDGVPLPGLTPTWVSLKRASDNTNYTPQPDITALGNGLYKTTHLTAHAFGTIDLGSAAFPRYIQYDSEAFPGGIKDLVPPTITIVSPTPGANPGDPGGFPSDPEIAMVTPIVVSVTDVDPGTQYISVFVRFVQIPGHIEVVFRAGQFVGLYTSSTVQAITDGFELTIVRTGGWVLNKTVISALEFSVDAIDGDGNLQ